MDWEKDTVAPSHPIAISGLPALTNKTIVQAQLTDPDIEKYRYAFGLSSSIDCNDLSGYLGETTNTNSRLDLTLNTDGEYSFCMIAADKAENWQNIADHTTLKIKRDSTRSKIINVTSPQADGVYGVGDKIEFVLSYDETVILTGPNPELEIASAALGSKLDNAKYKSGSNTTSLIFEYTVGNDNNGHEIYVKSILSKGGTIEDAATNEADQTIPIPNSMTNKDIDVDSVPSVTIQLIDISPGEVTGIPETTMTVTGSGIASFHYKLVSAVAECEDPKGYTSTLNMAPVKLDVTTLPDGDAFVCAVGVDSNDFVKPYKNYSNFSWVKDTTCGEVVGDGSDIHPFEIKKEIHLIAINNAPKCRTSSYKLMNSIALASPNWTPLGDETSAFRGNLMVRVSL